MTYLTSQSPVTSLIQSRVYPLGGVPFRTENNMGKRVKINTARLPYVVYETSSVRPEYSSDGMAGIAEGNLVIHCFGNGYKATHALKDAVIGEMSGYTGAWGSETVQSCRQVDETDNYFDPADGHAGRHRVSLEFNVTFVKAAPSF